MPGSSSPASFPSVRAHGHRARWRVSGGQVSGRHRQKMLRWGWVDQAACRNNEVSRSMRSSRETAPSTSA
jgi:hypothetical protein